MTTLVQTYSGLVHKNTCRAVPKGTMPTITGRRVVKFTVLAPEIDDAEEFIRARGLTPCPGTCWMRSAARRISHP